VAAANQGQGENGLFADINITPLVDVTLVLLIIFMVAAPLMLNNPSIQVELPKAASGEETQQATLALTVQRNPGGGYQLYANGERSDESGVRDLARRLMERNRELQAIIAADKGIAYGDVMHVVDLVRTLGVHRFALEIDQTP
jgi:biopolymer transport protein ExbD